MPFMPEDNKVPATPSQAGKGPRFPSSLAIFNSAFMDTIIEESMFDESSSSLECASDDEEQGGTSHITTKSNHKPPSPPALDEDEDRDGTQTQTQTPRSNNLSLKMSTPIEKPSNNPEPESSSSSSSSSSSQSKNVKTKSKTETSKKSKLSRSRVSIVGERLQSLLRGKKSSATPPRSKKDKPIDQLSPASAYHASTRMQKEKNASTTSSTDNTNTDKNTNRSSLRRRVSSTSRALVPRTKQIYSLVTGRGRARKKKKKEQEKERQEQEKQEQEQQQQQKRTTSTSNEIMIVSKPPPPQDKPNAEASALLAQACRIRLYNLSRTRHEIGKKRREAIALASYRRNHPNMNINLGMLALSQTAHNSGPTMMTFKRFTSFDPNKKIFKQDIGTMSNFRSRLPSMKPYNTAIGGRNLLPSSMIERPLRFDGMGGKIPLSRAGDMYKRNLAFLEKRRRDIEELKKKQALEAAAEKKATLNFFTHSYTSRRIRKANAVSVISPKEQGTIEKHDSNSNDGNLRSNSPPIAMPPSLRKYPSIPQVTWEENDVKMSPFMAEEEYQKISQSGNVQQEGTKMLGQAKSELLTTEEEGNAELREESPASVSIKNSNVLSASRGRQHSQVAPSPLQTLTANTIKLATAVNRKHN